VGSWNKGKYWEGRTQKADRSRSHSDDAAHRDELLTQIAQMRMSIKTDQSSSLAAGASDIRISSLLSWAETNHFNVYFDFDDIAIPAEVGPAPIGDKEALMAWAKRVVRAVRLAKGIAKTQMDVLLDQQNGVHNTWELRKGSFTMSSMQRVIRALGGTFRIRLEHKHNPGLSRRLTAGRRR